MTLVLDEDGRLPAGDPHPATLSEIYDTFVRQAPFRPRRERIYTCLELFTEQVWKLSPQATLWLNGGFTTHKRWAEPEDADVVALIPGEDRGGFGNAKTLPLRTLQNVTIRGSRPEGQGIEVECIQTYGGYLDTYIVVDTPAARAQWSYDWSRVNAPGKRLLPDTVRKGFVEVKHG